MAKKIKVVVKRGKRGKRGLQGWTGPTGPQGMAGIQGPAGKDVDPDELEYLKLRLARLEAMLNPEVEHGS